MTRVHVEIARAREFDNPFCTRRVRPGAMSFQFPQGDSADQLLDRLRANRWRAAIVGPHGSGKSTLLATLEALLVKRGHEVRRITLHDGQRVLPVDFAKLATLNQSTIVIVDGYEQLGFLSQRVLRWKCTLRGAGLVVTSHRPVGLTEIFRTVPTLELAQQLTGMLLSDCDAHSSIAETEIASTFAQHGQNIREMFFALYDLFEQRKSRQ